MAKKPKRKLTAAEKRAQGEAYADEYARVVSDMLNNMIYNDPDPLVGRLRKAWGIPEPEQEDEERNPLSILPE